MCHLSQLKCMFCAEDCVNINFLQNPYQRSLTSIFFVSQVRRPYSKTKKKLISRSRKDAMALIEDYRALIMEKNEDKSLGDAGDRLIAMRNEFFRIAREESDCTSATRDGMLHVRRGKMHKPFEEAAFALNVGDVSEVVDTNSGYHIIYRKS